MARGGASVFITSIAAYNPVDQAALKLCEDPLASGLIDQLEKMLPDTSPRAAYALSKAALTRMCELQASAWGKTGARIIALAPGLIATPMGAMEFEKNAHIKVPLLNMTPLGREGSMPEIAEVVSFLLSSGASYITGCDIRVDGGLVPARLIAEGIRK
jgi:NAD(P)-dependent dehydrogenase (short-subunit alcohol dehydrogenase family)